MVQNIKSSFITKFTASIRHSTLSKLLLLYVLVYVLNLFISVYGLYVSSNVIIGFVFIPIVLLTMAFNLFFIILNKVKKYPHELLLLPTFGLLIPVFILFLYLFLNRIIPVDHIKLTILENILYSLMVLYSAERLWKNMHVDIDQHSSGHDYPTFSLIYLPLSLSLLFFSVHSVFVFRLPGIAILLSLSNFLLLAVAYFKLHYSKLGESRKLVMQGYYLSFVNLFLFTGFYLYKFLLAK